MKKLVLILAGCMFLASASFAQSTAKSADSKSMSKKSYKYYCPKCMAGSDKAGECSACHMKMVKVGDYYCPGCGASSTKAGHCDKCNKDMVKMAAK